MSLFPIISDHFRDQIIEQCRRCGDGDIILRNPNNKNLRVMTRDAAFTVFDRDGSISEGVVIDGNISWQLMTGHNKVYSGVGNDLYHVIANNLYRSDVFNDNMLYVNMPVILGNYGHRHLVDVDDHVFQVTIADLLHSAYQV